MPRTGEGEKAMVIMDKPAPSGRGRERFDEMAMLPVSDKDEGLPFKIIVKSPDSRDRPHAHIFTLDSKRELGTFVITDNPPREIGDLVEYLAGRHRGLQDIPSEWREMIVKWAWSKSRRFNRFSQSASNWTALRIVYDLNKEGRG